MVRVVCPSAEVRLAGGREIHLRTLKPLALHIVNSIFLGDYLTSEGQPGAADLAMIADAGFTVEGVENPTAVPSTTAAATAVPPAAVPAASPVVPATARSVAELAPETPRPDLVHVRRRGAGTTLPANT
jgi:biotin synthase